MREVLVFHIDYTERKDEKFDEKLVDLLKNDRFSVGIRHQLAAGVRVDEKIDCKVEHYLKQALALTTSEDKSWECNKSVCSYVDDPRDTTEGDIFYIQGSFFILKGTGFWPINARIKEVK